MVTKMENEKFNVLAQVINERSFEFDYPDKAVFSNLYYTSLARSLQGMASTPDAEKADWEGKNEWLKAESSKVTDIPVIDFDNLVTLLDNRKTSCDVFFYNFGLMDNGFHFLGEFKRVNKRTFLDLLNLPNDHEDSIFRKVSDSIENIRHSLFFGGSQESDAIVQNAHFFAVYAGKNTIPTSAGPRVPTGNKALKDSNNKQTRATRSRRPEYTEKQEQDIYGRFSKKIESLNLKPRKRDTFPVKVSPRISPYFTPFSAQDFGKLIDSGFFDNWNWGTYLPDTESVAEDTAENT